MKRFIQVSLIVAAAFFGVGMILGMIGAFGNHQAIRKEAKEAFSEGGRLKNSFIRLDKDLFEKKYTDYVEEHENASVDGMESFDSDEIDSLDLELGAGNFVIETKSEKEEDTIEVRWTGDGEVECQEEDGVLKVCGFEVDQVINFVGIHANDNDQNQLVIRIPANKTLSKIEIDGGAGNFEIGGLKIGRLDLEGGAGEFKINGLTAEELDLEVGAGNLKATDVTTDQADLSVGMGNASIQGKITGDFNLECGMGNVKMDLAGSQKDHNYEIEAAAGTVKIGEEKSTALVTDKSIHNGADNTWRIECGIGNVKIKFEQ